jgi:hypothetical protein
MGTLYKNRKGVSDKMKKAILKKKGENVSVYKLMIMK